MISTLKRVFVWGQNKEHQLGINSSPNILNNIQASMKTEPLPKLLNLPKIKKIAAGYKHSLFIDIQGKFHKFGLFKIF